MNRKINIFTASLAGICVILAACWACDKKLGEKIPDDYFDKKPTQLDSPYIYQKGKEGYSCFRIPALIKTKAGTLLAFAEARKNSCADDADINTVLRRSEDSGKTWSDLITIWDNGDRTCGNPAPVLDESTGAIHLLMCLDNNQVFVSTSNDDGKTWDAPREITSTVKESSWTWYATGPCHGIQLKKGAHAGRLVIPCDHNGDSHIIYSDDHGATWLRGGNAGNGTYSPNESTVAELSDGRLMLNMRSSNSGNRRLSSISEDGGLSWSAPKPEDVLIDPVCQGSLLASGNALYFSNAASTTNRENMTLRQSTDDGVNFSKSYTVYAGPSAYSDLAMMDDSHVAILYERGESTANDGIAFEIIPVSSLK